MSEINKISEQEIKKDKKSIFLFVVFCYLFYLFLAFCPRIFNIQTPIFDYLESTINYIPSLTTIFLYLLGLIGIIFGFFLPDLLKTKFVNIKNNSKIFKGKIIFYIFLFLYIICVFANILILIKANAIPLFNISYRYLIDPKLYFIASLQSFFLPIIVFWLIYKHKKKFTILFFVISFILTILLGYRHIVFRIILTYFLVLFLFDKKLMKKTFLWFFALIFILFFLVGLISKSKIYSQEQRTKNNFVAPFELAFSDSVGNFQYLEKVQKEINLKGSKNGEIISQSFLSLIPGQKSRYANYIIGEIVTGKNVQTRTYDSIVFEQPVSITATFVGPFYADFKYIGVIMGSLIVGVMLSLLLNISLKNLLYVLLLIPFLIELCLSIYGGFFGASTLIIFSISIISVLIYFILYIQQKKNENRICK